MGRYEYGVVMHIWMGVVHVVFEEGMREVKVRP
jgi:hypothetical protein